MTSLQHKAHWCLAYKTKTNEPRNHNYFKRQI
jgi:hypothetical protein